MEDIIEKIMFVDSSDSDDDSHRTEGILIGLPPGSRRAARRRQRSKSLAVDNPLDNSKKEVPQPKGLINNTSQGRLLELLSVERTLSRQREGSDQANSPSETVPNDRLRELLIGDDNSESHLLFCELQELQEGDWHEKARWVRFEEDVEEGGGRWSKPFVATLPLHALFELRQCLTQGVVLLDIEPRSFQELIGLAVDAMVGSNQLETSLRDAFIETLLARHIHQHEHGQGPIKRGLAEIGKKFSSRRMDDGHHHSGGHLSSPQTLAPPQLTHQVSITEPSSPIRPQADQRILKRDRSPGRQQSLVPDHHKVERMRSHSIAVVGGTIYDDIAVGNVSTQLVSPASLLTGVAGLHVPSAPSFSAISTVKKDGPVQFVHKPNEHFAKKLPPGTEASTAMVGAVDYLNHGVSAFVRLSTPVVFDDLTEVAVPTRFFFVLLGPTVRGRDFHEIGRAMSTAMSDDIFRDVAYRARDRADILAGLDEFLDEVTILPPGEWDPTIRIQPPKSVPTQEERKIIALTQIAEENGEKVADMKRASSSTGSFHRAPSGGLLTNASTSMTVGDVEDKNRPPNKATSSAVLSDLVLKKQAESEEEQQPEGHGMDPALQRTGRIFGGLIEDVKRKAPWFLSDFRDALDVQCIAGVFFMFFACLAPIVTFGGLLGLATENNMAAFESILTGAICGTSYHLFAGQPITIIGSTGPVLLFEKILFSFAKDNDMNYLTLRFWIGVWTAAFLMLIVAFDLNALVSLITRFTEECFATLISVIFIFEAFIAIYGIYKANPISSAGNLAQNFSCWCDYPPPTDPATTLQPFGIAANESSNIFETATVHAGGEFSMTTLSGGNFSSSPANCSFLDLKNCSMTPQCQLTGPGCNLKQPVPDVFFFSCLIFFGTCGLTFALKNFRTSPFFPNKIRNCISDFAVSIAIFTMVAVDFFIDLPTPKLTVPQEFAPTKHDRAWIVEPFINPVWTIFAAPFPAFLLCVLLFMDQQITAVIVNRREHKLVKGKGYHLDLFVLTLHVLICASLGLPYFVAATVLSITHVNCLRKQSETSAPGEQPKFLGLIEQRVTGFLVFVLIGCSIPLRAILKFIPMPVLYGVFLFMGLSALQTSQFYNRCLLIFMPVKYQPDAPYLRHMRTWRVHLFTLIQLTAFIFLWAIKEFKQISILFILMLVIMIVIRKLLDFVFTEDELRWVDDLLPKNPLAVQGKEVKRNSSKPNLEAGNGTAVTAPSKPKSGLWRRFHRGRHSEEPESQPLQNQAPPVIVVAEHT